MKPFSDERMHLLYALVRKSSFSKAQGFVIFSTYDRMPAAISTRQGLLNRKPAPSNRPFPGVACIIDLRPLVTFARVYVFNIVCVFVFVFVFVFVSVRLFVYLLIYVFVYLFVCLFVCWLVCLFICLFD